MRDTNKTLRLISQFQYDKCGKGEGKNVYIVFYQKNPKFFGFNSEHDHRVLDRDDYEQLFAVRADSPEEVFSHMQGEVWSPEGEALSLIRHLELHHTSMSVGDVIRDCQTKSWLRVEGCGFTEVKMMFLGE